MSCTGETVLVSTEANPSLNFSRYSLLTKAVYGSPLVQSTVGNLMKIYCVARSVSSFRLALGAITYLRGHLCVGNQMLPQDYRVQFQNTKSKENGDLEIIVDKLFANGRKLVTELIQEIAPECLQDSELMRTFTSALGLPLHEKCPKTEGVSSIIWNDKDSISGVLWRTAEEKWRETAERLSMYKPEKMLHSAIELVQERVKDVVATNSLVSQILEAGGYLSATTQSIRSEAEILSQLLCERRDHTLANVTEFWNCYCENHTTLETLYSLVNDCVLSHVKCEGLELFSEYIWTMRPKFYELDFLEMNYPQVDDDAFHFVEEERVPRRSVLFIGSR